ncbi:MAG: CHAD domain-containing protein [Thermoleophilia bacterium]|nr:CHAD domain-containing protein [Thermoleophilia bacterium]MDH3725124.1 CHAD domain-containing protein [Thermoleophilia bacterium]
MSADVRQEREFKLLMESDARLPELNGVGGLAVRELDAHEANSTYWETGSERLAAWGCTLRFRGGTWTAKLGVEASAGALWRQEVSVSGQSGRVPTELRGLLRPFTRDEDLEPLAQLDAHREAFEICAPDGERLAVLTDDRVTASGAGVLTPSFREVEIELTNGSGEQALLPVVHALVAAGASAGDARPKLSRALGREVPARPEIRVPEVSATPTAREVIHAATATATCRLISHLPVAWIGEDPEGVHQARVAMRRLRSDLSTWEVLVDRRWADPLRDELKWLGGRLGAVRDLDVLIDGVQGLADGCEELDEESFAALIADLESRREAVRTSMRRAIRSARAASLLDGLVAAASDPPTAPQADDPARGLLQPLVRRRWRRMRKAARRMPAAPPDAALHELRIRAKRLRYAAEAVRPAVGAPAQRLAKAAAALQDALGDLNDAAVATRILGGIAEEDRRAAFAAGQVSGLMIARGQQVRGRWKRLWRELSRRTTRGWLDE